MPHPRTIAVVTGTRAEFGLLASVMQHIARHPRLRLRTIVTGTHLTLGTWRDVRQAGLLIDARVRMQTRGATGRAADVAALGRGIAGLGAAFAEMKPDVVLVLGDRIEAFAAASAASIGGFRVAHLHGGDRAEGVADEAMRHAISKLSHLHFAATALSRKRLIRMGEAPRAVFNVGSPAMDVFREDFAETLGLVQRRALQGVLILQHPIGDSDATEERRMRQTLRVVDLFHRTGRLRRHPRSATPRSSYVILPNSDPGSRGIIRAIERRVPLNLHNGGESEPFFAYRHLPRLAFLTVLSFCRVIVGNSSAGLIEAAAMKVPCVNIGPRQNGREKPGNVIDCDYGEKSITRALGKALRLNLSRLRHPYGNGRTGQRIARILAEIDFAQVPIRKRNTY